MKVHLKRISEQEAGWAYSLITVVTFLMTLGVGLLKLGVTPGEDQEHFGKVFIHCSLSDLPDELTFQIDNLSLPAEYAHQEVPASVRSQFSMNVTNQKIVSMQFHGWMRSDQRDSLLNRHKVLEWQAAIERLAEIAQPPDPLTDLIEYQTDHRALSLKGSLTTDGEAILLEISTLPRWQKVVAELAETSRQETVFSAKNPPEHFEIPGRYQETLSWDGKQLRVIGPVGPAMMKSLQQQFPPTRPMTEGQISDYLNKFSQMPGGVNEAQKMLVSSLLKSSWSAEQLISVLNEAGVPTKKQKSYQELSQEQIAGVEILEPHLPANLPAVELNDQQQQFIIEQVHNSEFDLTELGSHLQELGDWVPSQELR